MAATYCTQADVVAYIEGFVVDDATALDRLIQRAERDIDSIVGPWGFTTTTSSHTLPTGTIYVLSTDYLPSSGSVLLGGQTVAYTAKTETTLTGATGGTGTFSIGTAVRRVLAASGLKFDPITQLTTAQQGALKRATCAQVEYRFEQGEQFFVHAQYEQTSGPDFSQVGRLPYIGEKVYRELQGYGLLLETCVG